jgi:hypothetical protein
MESANLGNGEFSIDMYGGGPYNPIPRPNAKRPRDSAAFYLRSAVD